MSSAASCAAAISSIRAILFYMIDLRAAAFAVHGTQIQHQLERLRTAKICR
jgi:hypothetical protein